MQTVFLFGTPVMIMRMPNHDEIRSKFLPCLEEDKYFKKVSSWQSDVETTFELEDQGDLPWDITLKSLYQGLDAYLQNFNMTKDVDFVVHAWANRYKKGMNQEIHNHLGNNNAISCAYMMELPKDSGDFVFYKEGNNHWHTVGIADLCEENFPFSNRHTPPLNEGDVIFFPSYLDHYVTNNTNEQRRATVSANFAIKG